MFSHQVKNYKKDSPQMNASIPEKILTAITQKPGLTSHEIASQLTLDKK
jgi:hypothetical protein